jgi:hypothetical protein
LATRHRNIKKVLDNMFMHSFSYFSECLTVQMI